VESGSWLGCLVLLAVLLAGQRGLCDGPPEAWLEGQWWRHEGAGPVVSLGEEGAFDETHIFAPCVVRWQNRFWMWYSGSSGTIDERVFSLGLATSTDGLLFTKHPKNPVFRFPGGQFSVLTPCVLRSANGEPLFEEGVLRMWFSATHFAGETVHTLHETGSKDGLTWQDPSDALFENVYAPSVLKEGKTYKMWFADVSQDPWVLRYGESRDGTSWRVDEAPVMVLDQKWEKDRLFYPTVLRHAGFYLMWYGSYWADRPQSTAIGFALSRDGRNWVKSETNPVLFPDPTRPWESHYATSQSAMVMEDGSFRMWYASRKEPPFLNKYFAINQASWAGPGKEERSDCPDPAKDAEDFASWQREQRRKLGAMLGLPSKRCPLASECRGSFVHDGLNVEKWVFTSEPGSKIPAVVYVKQETEKEEGGAKRKERRPGIVLTYGHGGSKSQPAYNYMGQVFAKLGFVCLAMDPIGEEERHVEGRLGTRAHDPEAVHLKAWGAGRPIMGKLVWDTMRGVDFILDRDDVDPERVGVAGNSLGGAKAAWMLALDTRLRFAIVSGWAFGRATEVKGKFCTRVANHHVRMWLSWDQFLSLAAPHCAVLIVNGDADTIIDFGDGSAWRHTDEAARRAGKVYEVLGGPGSIQTWYEKGGGHRPYPAHKAALSWLVQEVLPSGWTPERVQELSEINFGEWCEREGYTLEKLYATELHLLGATVADMGISHIDRRQLAVLEEQKKGAAAFTLRGWLEGL